MPVLRYSGTANRSPALHVHVVYLHYASWVICSLPKTLSGQCNLNSTVEQKIKHVYILCKYTVNAHKLFCRFKSICMDGMLISVKMAREVPAARNRPDVIERRFEYANWFMTQGVINDCIFIDECGYNI